MTTLEILKFAAKLAAPLASILAAVALILNARAFRLQKRSMQANLFNDIRRRIDDLEDQHSEIEQGEMKKLEIWYERLFNAFENYAFYVNHGYLEKEMTEFYAIGISQFIKRAQKFPSLIEYFKTRKKGQFSELEKYCLKLLKEKLPF